MPRLTTTTYNLDKYFENLRLWSFVLNFKRSRPRFNKIYMRWKISSFNLSTKHTLGNFANFSPSSEKKNFISSCFIRIIKVQIFWIIILGFWIIYVFAGTLGMTDGRILLHFLLMLKGVFICGICSPLWVPMV